ncbi:MAG: hypothetical protein ACTHN5_16955 [Phycisphaerae bacterium]
MVANSPAGVMEEMHEEPWGEQYFEGLTEHGPEEVVEACRTMMERAAGKVRKYPWVCMGVALGLGALLGISAGGLGCGGSARD